MRAPTTDICFPEYEQFLFYHYRVTRKTIAILFLHDALELDALTDMLPTRILFCTFVAPSFAFVLGVTAHFLWLCSLKYQKKKKSGMRARLLARRTVSHQDCSYKRTRNNIWNGKRQLELRACQTLKNSLNSQRK